MKKYTLAGLAIVMALFWDFSGNRVSVDIKAPERKETAVPENVASLSQKQSDLSVVANSGTSPLYFIQNKGQVDATVLYYAKTPSYVLWVTKDGLLFDSLVTPTEETKIKPEDFIFKRARVDHDPEYKRETSWLKFSNSQKSVDPKALSPAEYRMNFFIGDDSSKWHKNVPTSRAILFEEIYKNIDLKIYGNEKQIEYDWIIRPGGNPGDIQFEYGDVKKTGLNGEGDLVVQTEARELIHKKPEGYQKMADSVQDIEIGFKKMGSNKWGFATSAYDSSGELIIDPLVLVSSTYLGGSSYETGFGIAVDDEGAVYVTGETFSANFPKKDPYQRKHKGEWDIFVTKLSPSGDSLVWSTFFGGSSYDFSKEIVVDDNGDVYVCGSTGSTNFPLKNPFQEEYGGGNFDAVVFKLAGTGDALEWSTYLGGTLSEGGGDIAVDEMGSAYITGGTYSSDFPVKSAFQSSFGGNVDAFVTKFAPAGNSLIWSSYYGDSGYEEGAGIAVDKNGAVYICSGDGYTVLVTKIAPEGNSLLWHYSLDGNSEEAANEIAVDKKGAVYVTGYTWSTNFPTKNAVQSVHGGGVFDAFVTKLKPKGNGIVWSTYLGGNGEDHGHNIALDPLGGAYVVGTTISTNFPAKKFLQRAGGLQDAFVVKFSKAGKPLVWSTYLGGTSDESGWGISVDTKGAVYVTGRTSSSDFPAKKALRSSLNGPEDAFVVKLGLLQKLKVPVLRSPKNGASNLAQTMKLSWKDANKFPQEENYTIRIKPAGGDYKFYDTSIDAVDFYISELSPGETYYWNVMATGNKELTKDSSWANSGKDRKFSTK